MEKVHILLLRPTGDRPAAEDQCGGAFLVATQGFHRDQMILEQDSFQQDELDDLEKTVRRWAGKVSGVVGATNVLESTRLGELAEQLDLLCFVSNNNPAVWQQRSHVFHIGVPTAMISKALAERLVRDGGVKRICLLHDTTDFQSHLASTTASSLKDEGAEICSEPGSVGDWLDHVQLWKPDLLYLVYSNESLALPLAQSLRRVLPNTLLLVGMSLLRYTFFASLGEAAEGLLLVDIFHRGAPQREQEKIFTRALNDAEVPIPTANHGFGWDAMTLCGLALTQAHGDLSAAIQYMESGVYLEGATGFYRFSTENHNGRATFNPILLSRLKNGRVETYKEGSKPARLYRLR